VQHLAPGRHSQLARILNKKTELIVKEARNLELISPHTVYMAPPDAHILVKDGGRIHLTHSVQVNFVRPSADLLFDSLAVSYPARVVGVVLTGKGTDGTEGVKAIRKSGGKVIAQDRLSSEYFDMPSSAINAGCVDLVLSLEEIPPAILNLFSGEIQ
jgi:two-component system chemotaxis response regulator CheB